MQGRRDLPARGGAAPAERERLVVALEEARLTSQASGLTNLARL